MLEIRHAHIGRAKTLYAIDEVTLLPGKLYALIGANGAGKSTLLDAIALGEHTGGEIRLDNAVIADLSLRERALKVALVESRFHGSEYLSTQEYLDLGRFPHTGFQGVLKDSDKEVVARVAAQLHLEHLLRQSTFTLSDGERQRASIARALIQETALILLDEPTSFLDYPNKRAIMKLLKTIAHEQQKIILLASHDLELCLDYCDECLVINPETRELEQYPVTGLPISELITKAFGD
ncbi:MAG TPA: ABC transporter ATP-binding protein [Fluviicola sp.]|nr:ABC transporter ATP-binding protein [Fluviicola sp.]